MSTVPIPYRNLIITGLSGAGRKSAGRGISERLGVPWLELEAEIERREKMPPDEIRQLFGESRLEAIQAEMCRELALHRSTVLVIGGTAMLHEESRRRLAATGPVLCLTCALDEILRRQHVAKGLDFLDPLEHTQVVARLRREMRVLELGFQTLDTTYLSVDQLVDRAIAFWRENADR